ncbi:hypothetical protein, partial [Burkholderia cenocepacia]|uniref:hypothetical protein n=1 Tax=Burkholderia cenocepacia TaxID=95486 RepID=UPI002230278E
RPVPAGVAIPTTPPYTLEGRFRRDGDVCRYEKFSGTAGDSDLSGTAEIDLRTRRCRRIWTCI